MTALDDSEIDKPFDRMLKDFAQEAPRLLLHALGIAPLDANVVLHPLKLEVAPTVRQADYVAFLVEQGQPPYVFHAEFIVNFTKESPDDMTEYGVRLVLQYRKPVRSIAVLLNPHRAPLVIPAIGELVYGETRMSHPYQVVLIWEVDPAPILAAGDFRLLPWAVLMKSTDEEVRRIGAVLGQSGDEEAISRFLTLGSIRYDRTNLLNKSGSGTL